MSYLAEEIARWAASLEFAGIPPEVINTAKKCLADWAGITIYGSTSPWSQAVARMVKESGGREEATLIGDGFRLPAAAAALVNGISTLSFDISDTFMETALHPSCAIISAAVAAAEKYRTDSKKLLTGVIAGYEVASRLGKALNGPPKRTTSSKGFEANALIPAFGATVAAGRIIGLSEKQMVNALGLASCSATGGLVEYLLDGNWTYRWNGGRGGHDGVLNALAAQNGFIGPGAVFEGHWDDKGRFGLISAFTGSIESAAEMTRGLGREWHIQNIGFKYYGCCHYIHGFIDGILKLMKEKRFGPENIEQIECFLSHMTLFLAVPRKVKARPANLTVSQWSLPYCLAIALLDGHLLNPAEQLTRLDDARVLHLTDRIKGTLSEDLDRIIAEKGILQSPYKVKLTGGQEYSGVTACKGFPYNPLSEEEHRTKFITLSSGILGKDRASSLYTALGQVEQLDDITSLVRSMHR